MGFEVWIAIVALTAALSGCIGYAVARKGAPKQTELDAMEAELEEARQQAESVQSNVSEHFEQSALLFGKLAADYREFLDHFSESAQNLGLSEARARELIEQGFQPLLTHDETDVVADSVGEEVDAGQTVDTAGPEEDAGQEDAGEDQAAVPVGEVTVEMPDEMPEESPEQTAREEVPQQLSGEADESLQPEKPGAQVPSLDTVGREEEEQARQRA